MGFYKRFANEFNRSWEQREKELGFKLLPHPTKNDQIFGYFICVICLIIFVAIKWLS